MKLNYYKSIKNPQVQRDITVEWWLSEIKTGSLYGKEIAKARAIGKGQLEYNSIKESLPAVTWNFLFDGYKKDSNIVQPTGFLYYDIDDSSFNTEILDKSKIYSFFNSLSNQGKTIIVKASGVTQSNFNDTYKSIARDLNIDKYVDINAIKKSQYTVLTHDSEAFINTSSFIYPPCESQLEISELKEEPKKVSLAPNKRKGKRHIGANDTFLKYNNLDVYSIKNDVVINKDGWDVIELYLPATIKTGQRKHTLLSYCNNLVILNPDASQEQIFAHLMERNQKRCVPALNQKEVFGVVTSIFRYKKEGTLKPKEIKKRKIIFGKECGMDKADKQSFAANQVAEWKKDKTKQKMYDAIELMTKKITAEGVSQSIGMGIATVKRYWPEFKEYVKEKNKSFKC